MELGTEELKNGRKPKYKARKIAKNTKLINNHNHNNDLCFVSIKCIQIGGNYKITVNEFRKKAG